MDAARATRARRQGRRPTGALGAARDCQRDLLRRAQRLHLETAAPRSAALADGLLLLSHLAPRWDAGSSARTTAGAAAPHARSRPDPQRRHHRESIGEDDRKGGPPRKPPTIGYDGGKQVKGRKRHLLVDTQGFVLKALVHAADVADRDGGELLLGAFGADRARFPPPRPRWVDAGYRCRCVDWG